MRQKVLLGVLVVLALILAWVYLVPGGCIEDPADVIESVLVLVISNRTYR